MSLTIAAETKVDCDPCVAAWDGKLFVGTDGGSVKVYDANLNPSASWQAHDVQLFALAASNNKVYSSSNDGGIRVWGEDGTKITELPSTGADVGVIKVYGEDVYAGDEDGNVVLYEKNDLKAKYNVLEEVKDLGLRQPYLFTVRDLDVTVTEIKPDDAKTRCVTRHTMEGRAPIGVAGSYLLVMARDGNTLRLHSASVDTTFKKLFEVKFLFEIPSVQEKLYALKNNSSESQGVSDMIVTSLRIKDSFVWTAGWDGSVRRWQIVEDKLVTAGEISLGSCVNALVLSSEDTAYTVLAGGRIVKIKSS